jgi:outer membrane protein assembly factor BamB
VYVGDEDGDVCVFASDKKLKLLSEVNVGAPVYSTPIVANGTLYIGSQTHLFAIAEGAKPVEAKPALPATPPGQKPRP